MDLKYGFENLFKNYMKNQCRLILPRIYISNGIIPIGIVAGV